MDGLIQEYQDEITMLYNKRMELSRQLHHYRGAESRLQSKRLEQLNEMYSDTVFALKLLVRSKQDYNNFR